MSFFKTIGLLTFDLELLRLGCVGDVTRFASQRAQRGILMPRGKNCRETIFAARLPRNCPHRRGNFERGKNVLLLWGRGNLGGILRDNLVARVIESQKLPRDSGESIFAARHQGVSHGPLGLAQKYDRFLTTLTLQPLLFWKEARETPKKARV